MKGQQYKNLIINVIKLPNNMWLVMITGYTNKMVNAINHYKSCFNFNSL